MSIWGDDIMTDLLVVDGLTAGYERTIAIEEISLSLAAGERLALLGRNGVGKTTVLASIMGLTNIHGGLGRLNGLDLRKVPVHHRLRQGIGYVPQEREIFPSLSVHENLLVAVRTGAWTVDRVYELFPRLAARHRNLGNQLSGGEQQMLAMGRALVGNPLLLLLDEPFEGLAPVIVDLLVDALHRISREGHLAVILVEQHADLALEFAERAVVLDRGRVAWSGASMALRNDPDRLAELIGLQS